MLGKWSYRHALRTRIVWCFYTQEYLLERSSVLHNSISAALWHLTFCLCVLEPCTECYVNLTSVDLRNYVTCWRILWPSKVYMFSCMTCCRMIFYILYSKPAWSALFHLNALKCIIYPVYKHTQFICFHEMFS